MFTLIWTPEAKAAYDRLKAKAEASLASRQEKGKGESPQKTKDCSSRSIRP